MRKCCCCISVHVGSAILGFIGLMMCAAELVLLLPYLFKVEEFNPIEKHQAGFWKVLEETVEETKNPNITYYYNQFITTVQPYSWAACVGFAIEAGIYSICCLLLIIGASCRIRGLMIPYLIIQMFCIIVMVLITVAVTVALFLMGQVVVGIVATVVTLVISALLIYFWAAVQRAFMELGNNDYMYSPAPIKPVGVGHYDGRGGHADHYPTSPQHFPMDERH